MIFVDIVRLFGDFVKHKCVKIGAQDVYWLQIFTESDPCILKGFFFFYLCSLNCRQSHTPCPNITMFLPVQLPDLLLAPINKRHLSYHVIWLQYHVFVCHYNLYAAIIRHRHWHSHWFFASCPSCIWQLQQCCFLPGLYVYFVCICLILCILLFIDKLWSSTAEE